MSVRARRSRILGVAGVALAVCGVIAIVVAVMAQQAAPQPPASAAVPVAVTPYTTPGTSSRATAPGANSSGVSAGSASAAPPASAASPLGGPSAAGATSSEPAASGTSSPPAYRTRTTSEAPSPPPTSAPTPAPTPSVHGPILARSLPVHLSIPAIGVQSDLKTIGLTTGGEIETPPLVRDSHAYWLNVSPTPGQLGPSVILGHVDSARWGPAVFFDLGKLRQHNKLSVTLADGTVAVFEVTHVNEYSKADFPTMAVYGNTDRAALRLMTCGGTFDYAKRSYESNIVVYAALVSSHHTDLPS